MILVIGLEKKEQEHYDVKLRTFLFNKASSFEKVKKHILNDDERAYQNFGLLRIVVERALRNLLLFNADEFEKLIRKMCHNNNEKIKYFLQAFNCDSFNQEKIQDRIMDCTGISSKIVPSVIVVTLSNIFELMPYCISSTETRPQVEALPTILLNALFDCIQKDRKELLVT